MKIELTVKEAEKIAWDNIKQIEELRREKIEKLVKKYTKQKRFGFFGRYLTRNEALNKMNDTYGKVFSERESINLSYGNREKVAKRLLRACRAVYNDGVRDSVILETAEIECLLSNIRIKNKQ